jgi:flagellar protein FliO/FliZ
MDMSIITSLLQVLLATGFVLLLAWGGLSLIRRSRFAKHFTGKTTDSSGLVFLRAMPVGQRERLVVVRYQGAQLLIGVTAGGISLLRTDPAFTPDDHRRSDLQFDNNTAS